MHFFKKIIRGARLLKEAFGEYKRQIAIFIGIGFLGGILEGVGANALIPLFTFIIGEGEANDLVSRAIEQFFGFVGVDFSITYLLVFIALLFVAKSAVLFVGFYIQTRITYGYEIRSRTILFKRMLEADWQHLLKQKIGLLEKVLSVEIRYVTRLLETLGSFILILANLLVFFLISINISPSITLVAVGTGVIITAGFQPIVNIIRRLSNQAAERFREIAHFINENVLGMKTVKSMSAAAPIGSIGEKHFEALRALQVKRALIGNISGAFFQPFSVIFVLLLFVFSFKSGDFSLPAFIAIVYLIQRIFSQIQGFQSHLQTIFRMLPYLEHVLAYGKAAQINAEEDTGKGKFELKTSFSFKNVSFGYEGGNDVLSHISFSANHGSFIGLIGPSGSGKTTIVDLALRLLRPASGTIFLDATPISDIALHDYRRNIGYVSQDIHLINDTVANNIRFFDETISDKEVVQAAKQANIYDVVESLPKKFKTVVGERGVRLSAGQRQRIVIARVLARNPQILILDEATSALDNESELRIQEVIENLKGAITVLVIAHRLGTVMNCDELFVLENGRIIEKGKPQDLLADKKSYFFKVYNIRE